MITNEIMQKLFTGDPVESIKRICLGLHTFDRAFITSVGEIGMPIGTGYEVFGVNNLGKSTFCYSLMGLLGKALDTKGVLADLEGFDPNHLARVLLFQGYPHTFKIINQGTDEFILETLEDTLYVKDSRKKDEYDIGMLDTVGAISPISEKKGNLGEAGIGHRAFLMAKLSRRLLPMLHPRLCGSTKVFFFVNHWYSKVAQQGWDTPGGDVKKYICGVRLHLKRKELFDNIDGSYVIEGRVYKNKHGILNTKFVVFMKAGVGIHKGLTALYECVLLKHAKRIKNTNEIKLGEQSFGKLKAIIKNEWENDSFFQPFYDALKEND